jgi:hypothetical protein
VEGAGAVLGISLIDKGPAGVSPGDDSCMKAAGKRYRPSAEAWLTKSCGSAGQNAFQKRQNISKRSDHLL